MYSKRSITDFVLIILLIVITVLLSVSGYFHFNVKKRIYEDSYFINQLGLIRGNIQRFAKLKLIGKPNTEILLNINLMLNDLKFFIKKEKKHNENFYKNFSSKLEKIKNELEKLNISTNKKEIITLSEKLWTQSNQLVNIALKYHKYKFIKAINTFNFLIYSTVAFLLLIIFFIYKKVKKGLEIDTITDKLTGLYNRVYFNEIYNYFIEKYERDNKPFSMFIIDIDDFKKINDTYGHTTGDEVLKQIGEIIKHSIRKTDFAFRYGGEEFVIIFPDTPINEAYKIAKRILEKIPLKIKINLESVTISGGIGEHNGQNSKEFFEKIDEALYKAKNNGKNQIKKI